MKHSPIYKAYLLKNLDTGSDALRATDKMMFEKEVTIASGGAATLDLGNLLQPTATVDYIVAKPGTLNAGVLTLSSAVADDEKTKVYIMVKQSDLKDM